MLSLHYHEVIGNIEENEKKTTYLMVDAYMQNLMILRF